MFRIYGSTLGPLALALAITAIYCFLKRRRQAKGPPGPPGSIEYIRWRASQEDYEDYPHGYDGYFVCPECLELRLIANEG